VRLATKSARVKVLVLVYELNVKVTYFKSLAKNNGKLCKKQGGGWMGVGEKCDTHTHYLIFTALGRNKKSAKVKSRIAPRGKGVWDRGAWQGPYIMSKKLEQEL